MVNHRDTRLAWKWSDIGYEERSLDFDELHCGGLMLVLGQTDNSILMPNQPSWTHQGEKYHDSKTSFNGISVEEVSLAWTIATDFFFFFFF